VAHQRAWRGWRPQEKITAHYIIECTASPWRWVGDCHCQWHDRLNTHKFIYRRRWRAHFALDVHRPLSPTYNLHKWGHRMGFRLFSAAFVAWSTSTSLLGSLDSKPNLDPGLYLPRRRSCTELVGASSKTLVAWSIHSRYTGREKDAKRFSRQKKIDSAFHNTPELS
jgi:hypothetical protein